jgi:P-type E1-E2 ATPase
LKTTLATNLIKVSLLLILTSIETNKQKVLKVTADGSTEEIYSSDIFVGDILYIPED